MSKQTKLILTVLGLAAIVVPVVLLLTLSSKPSPTVNIPSGNRNIDTQNIQDITNEAPSPSPVPSPVFVPSPSPATTSAPLNPPALPSPSAKP